MSNWSIYYKSGDNWVSDGVIARPNQDLSTPIESTLQIVQLEDGSEGIISPEVKSKKSEVIFIWTNDDKTLFDKIQEYIDNGKYIKIETHLSGVEFIGYFLSIRPTWLVGKEPDTWGIEAIFKPLE